MRPLIVDHYGADGVHGKDIMGRGFLDGLMVRKISNPDDSIPSDSPDASLVSVPIGCASQVVHEIIDRRGENHPIIDLTGVMRSSNVGIPLPFPHIHHVHFLFGPQGKGPLNAIACRGRVRSVIFEHIINNVALSSGDFSVQVAEAPHEAHDVSMALVQGCTHAVSTILALQGRLPDELTQRRRPTPSTTIADMMTLNPRVSPLINEIFSGPDASLKVLYEKALQKMQTYLSQYRLCLNTFQTPYFEMYLKVLTSIGSLKGGGELLQKLIRLDPTELVAEIEKSKSI